MRVDPNLEIKFSFIQNLHYWEIGNMSSLPDNYYSQARSPGNTEYIRLGLYI